MTTKQLLKRIADLREHIAEEVGGSVMDLVDELVELELQAEQLSNQ